MLITSWLYDGMVFWKTWHIYAYKTGNVDRNYDKYLFVQVGAFLLTPWPNCIVLRGRPDLTPCVSNVENLGHWALGELN